MWIALLGKKVKYEGIYLYYFAFQHTFSADNVTVICDQGFTNWKPIDATRVLENKNISLALPRALKATRVL